MFYHSAKAFAILAQPSSLIVAALILYALRPWHKLCRGCLIGGLGAIIIFGLMPTSNALMLPLENRFARTDLTRGAPITGFIILGGMVNTFFTVPRELASLNEAAERITEAVALARQYPQARVAVVGGDESTTIVALLEALGIERKRIALERESRDTYENAIFAKRLVNPSAHERWVLITSAFHMPRAIGCFRKVGFHVEPWPVDYRIAGIIWPNTNIVDGLRLTDFVTREYVGLVAYFLAGRTEALLPGP